MSGTCDNHTFNPYIVKHRPGTQKKVIDFVNRFDGYVVSTCDNGNSYVLISPKSARTLRKENHE